MREAGAFSASEMVEVAIQLEQNGQVFYLEAAQRAQDPEAQRLLEFLAHEEQRHEAAFRELQPTETEHRPAEEYPGEKSEYIQVLLEERLLPSQEVVDKALGLASDRAILDFALGFEKDTILFYYEMRHLLGQAQQPIIADIIQQEKTHVERLTRLCQRCKL